jgi:hypothetical protein
MGNLFAEIDGYRDELCANHRWHRRQGATSPGENQECRWLTLAQADTGG